MKKIVVIGGTGFVGQEVGVALCRNGYQVILTSRKAQPDFPIYGYPCEWWQWNPETEEFPLQLLEQCDGIINLAGESVAEGMWTNAKKERLRYSRVNVTKRIAQAISTSTHKPSVYIQASAVGYYGDRGETALNENSPPGTGFLSELSQDWEDASNEIAKAGVRRCLFRIGVVLGLGGGILEKLLPLYADGLGANLGGGKQWLSWIHIRDLASLMVRSLEDETYSEVFNAVSPVPIRFSEFHHTLADKLKVMSPWGAPKIILKAALGQKSAIVLDSQRVYPNKALELGFTFSADSLNTCLTDLLGETDIPGLHHLMFRQWLAKDQATVWDFFSQVSNLDSLTPPEMKFKTSIPAPPELRVGARFDHKMKVHGLSISWQSLISSVNEGVCFVDKQTKGPYKHWTHNHNFSSLGDGTLVTDKLAFRLPFYRLSSPLVGWIIEKDIRKAFAYRQQQLAQKFS
jgi:uncharacterized protein (TIGR01777 family)